MYVRDEVLEHGEVGRRDLVEDAAHRTQPRAQLRDTCKDSSTSALKYPVHEHFTAHTVGTRISQTTRSGRTVRDTQNSEISELFKRLKVYKKIKPRILE